MLLFFSPKHKYVPKIGVPCVFPIYLLWPKINCNKAFKKIWFTECLREKYVNPENYVRRRFSCGEKGNSSQARDHKKRHYIRKHINYTNLKYYHTIYPHSLHFGYFLLSMCLRSTCQHQSWKLGS